jgi:hypothetical protein
MFPGSWGGGGIVLNLDLGLDSKKGTHAYIQHTAAEGSEAGAGISDLMRQALFFWGGWHFRVFLSSLLGPAGGGVGGAAAAAAGPGLQPSQEPRAKSRR